MNKKHSLFQLREALEALTETIREVEADPEDDDVELGVGLTHVFHHLNTAWNARMETEARTTACSDSDFKRWRQFPKDIEL